MSDPSMASFDRTDASYGPEPDDQAERGGGQVFVVIGD